MGAIIESVHACVSREEELEGSVALAVRAAERALEEAECRSEQLDLLVNTAVYRDGNVYEPATAAFIQDRIGANSHAPTRMRAEGRTLSFDLINGGCGLLDAIRAIDGLIRSGRVSRALVVTSDVDPTPGVSRGLAFGHAGAALLLRRGETQAGFSGFRSESYPKHAHLTRSGLHWIGGEPGRPSQGPGHAIVAEEDPRYLAECVDCAQRTTRRLLSELELTRDDLDLIIPSQLPRGFPRALRESVGIDASRVVDVTDEFGTAYTAGVAAALQAAMRRGLWARARKVLFLAVGAGINVAGALYTKDPDH
jgi:3-oxoacyl-[acyl-carrier-protein] synthase-3